MVFLDPFVLLLIPSYVIGRVLIRVEVLKANLLVRRLRYPVLFLLTWSNTFFYGASCRSWLDLLGDGGLFDGRASLAKTGAMLRLFETIGGYVEKESNVLDMVSIMAFVSMKECDYVPLSPKLGMGYGKSWWVKRIGSGLRWAPLEIESVFLVIQSHDGKSCWSLEQHQALGGKGFVAGTDEDVRGKCASLLGLYIPNFYQDSERKINIHSNLELLYNPRGKM